MSPILHFFYFFTPLVVLSLVYWNEILEFLRIFFFVLPFLDLSYDFVVVGGGSAGSAVAARLAENGVYSVLLLEAGPTSPYIADVPLIVAALTDTPIDWSYRTVPQKHCCHGFENNSSHWTSGKVVGGGSVLNYMLYVRGNKLDYDHWAELGNEGWSYEDVLPFFKKAENQRGSYKKDEEFHGLDGPLSVENRRHRSSLADVFIRAGQELGFDEVDINGRNQTGFTAPQVTMKDGQRWSAARAYLRGNSRQNLFVFPKAFAKKIVTEVENGQPIATGVEFSVYGMSYFVEAKKEVIVSSGTVGSAKLLMLSGIGPKEDLDELKINVVKDLRVGLNLQDHLTTTVSFVHKDSSLLPPHPLNLMAHFDFLFRGKGPYTGNGVDGMSFTSTKYSERPDWPDLQIHFLSFTFATDFGTVLRRAIGMTDEAYQVHEKLAGLEAAMFGPTLVRPKSRGQVKLRSSNPSDQPFIDPQYFSHPEDVKVLIEGLKFSIKVARTDAFKKENISLVLFPCGGQELETDQYFECLVRSAPITIYHPAGTCKMGPDSDPDAVVDSHLRVRGVKRLRVIDNSIMPTIVNGNTNAPAIMIGEKGAKMIIDSWNEITSSEESFARVKTEL